MSEPELATGAEAGRFAGQSPANTNMLLRFLTQLGTASSAAGLTALIAKLSGAADLQIAIISAGTIVAAYVLLYGQFKKFAVSTNVLIATVVLLCSVVMAEKDQLLNRIVDVSGISQTTGIIQFVPHANDWLPHVRDYMEHSKEEIWLSGTSFYVTLPQMKGEILKKLGEGVDVRFMIYSPLSQNLHQVAQMFGQSDAELESELHVTVDNLLSLEQISAERHLPGRLQVRMFDSVPTERIYIFDRRSPNGYTFLIPHVDNRNTPELPGFLVKNIKTGVAPAYFSGVEDMWASATPFDEFKKLYHPPTPPTPLPPPA